MRLDRICLHSFARAPLGRDSTVVDLGGHRGEFSTGVIDRYGCQVLAVEPVPALYQAFPERLGLDVVNAAVTEASGPVELHVNPTSCSGLYAAEAGARVVVVAGMSLDDLLDEYAIGSVDLLKMDIEGAEITVLSTVPEEVLLRCRQITVEFHPDLHPEMHPWIESVIVRLRGLGFQVVLALGVEDVLFLHPSLRIGNLEYGWTVLRDVWIRNRLRWLRLGLKRRLDTWTRS